MKQTFLVPVFIIISLISGCQAVKVDQYTGREPLMDPKDFFQGKLRAHGVIKDYQGFVARSFNAEVTACWQDNIGVLDEQFVFDDGELQSRVWRLMLEADGSYVATAGDVKGAGQAVTAGNAMFLDYVLTIPFNEGTIDVSVDDKMYRVHDNILINESVLRKFGLPVGSILLTMIRYPKEPVVCPIV